MSASCKSEEKLGVHSITSKLHIFSIFLFQLTPKTVQLRSLEMLCVNNLITNLITKLPACMQYERMYMQYVGSVAEWVSRQRGRMGKGVVFMTTLIE